MRSKGLIVDLKRDRFLINILGEVCWGFKVEDFKKKIGVKLETAEALLKKMIENEKKGSFNIYLSASEVKMLRNSFIEVKKEIEEWEFQTRVGVTLEEIEESLIFYKSIS